MNTLKSLRNYMLPALTAVALAVVIGGGPSLSLASGGTGGSGGGGGTPKPVELRVTGYVSAIDYAAGTISIGQSYYGSNSLKVDSSTRISINTVNASFTDIQLGDWTEARFIYPGLTATKLSVTR